MRIIDVIGALALAVTITAGLLGSWAQLFVAPLPSGELFGKGCHYSSDIIIYIRCEREPLTSLLTWAWHWTWGFKWGQLALFPLTLPSLLSELTTLGLAAWFLFRQRAINPTP